MNPLEWARWAAAQETDECIRPEYRQITFGGRRAVRTYVVVCILAHGAEPGEVAHSCRNGSGGFQCCNKRHVRWASHAENEADKVTHGTATRGERNPSAKLSAEQVEAIRADERAATAIAAEFDVHPQHIRAIRRGRFWRGSAQSS